MIEFINSHKEANEFLTPDIEPWLMRLCTTEGKRLGELGVHLVSDDELLEVNRSFLNHDYLTDIITFDRCYGKVVTGELWISLDRVMDNAHSLGVDSLEEFNRVLAHGVLHLLGYKDKTDADAAIMRRKEAEALALRLIN
jgi:rRNA maturation RNase YbeY